MFSARFFGDPHIGTLDGGSYTFNGYGEYTMMKINAGDVQFELQARTDLAVSANGTTINATIFSAFVAKDQSGASMQIELSRDKDSELWYLVYLKKLHVNDEKLSTCICNICKGPDLS